MDSGYLMCAQLLQFHANSFKSLHLLCTWSERYACGLDVILRLFFVIFSQFELSHLLGILVKWKEGTLSVQLLLQFNTDTFTDVDFKALSQHL